MRDGRHHHLERSEAIAHQRHGVGKNAKQPLDLAGPASRQHQQDRRRGEPATRLLVIRAQIARLLDQRMADIGAGRAAQALVDRRLKRQ